MTMQIPITKEFPFSVAESPITNSDISVPREIYMMMNRKKGASSGLKRYPFLVLIKFKLYSTSILKINILPVRETL